MNIFRTISLFLLLLPGLITASSPSKPAHLMIQVKGLNQSAAGAASPLATGQPAVSPMGTGVLTSKSIPSARFAASPNPNPDPGASGDLKSRPGSALTGSGNVAPNSKAHGQSTHEAHFANDRRRSKSSNEFKVDGPQPIAAQKDAALLSQKTLNEALMKNENRKIISKIIAASLTHAQKIKKMIESNESQDAIAKKHFKTSLLTLIRTEFKKSLEAEDLVLNEDLIQRKVDEIWEDKEQYRSKCC